MSIIKLLTIILVWPAAAWLAVWACDTWWPSGPAFQTLAVLTAGYLWTATCSLVTCLLSGP